MLCTSSSFQLKCLQVCVINGNPSPSLPLRREGQCAALLPAYIHILLCQKKTESKASLTPYRARSAKYLSNCQREPRRKAGWPSGKYQPKAKHFQGNISKQGFPSFFFSRIMRKAEQKKGRRKTSLKWTESTLKSHV